MIKNKLYTLLALAIISLTGCSSTNNEVIGLNSSYNSHCSESIVAETKNSATDLNTNSITEDGTDEENPSGPHPDNSLIEINGTLYSWTPNVTIFAVKNGYGYNLPGCEYEYSRYIDEYNTLLFIGTGDEFGLDNTFSLYETSDGNIFVTYKCLDVKAYSDSSEWLKDYSEEMFFEGFVYKKNDTN